MELLSAVPQILPASCPFPMNIYFEAQLAECPLQGTLSERSALLMTWVWLKWRYPCGPGYLQRGYSLQSVEAVPTHQAAIIWDGLEHRFIIHHTFRQIHFARASQCERQNGGRHVVSQQASNHSNHTASAFKGVFPQWCVNRSRVVKGWPRGEVFDMKG